MNKLIYLAKFTDDRIEKLLTISQLTELNDGKPFTEYEFLHYMLNNQSGIILNNDDNKSVIRNPDGLPYFSFLWVVGSWWNATQNLKLDNVMMIHFNEIKQNLREMIINIANFIQIDDIDFNSKLFDQIVDNCSLESMKKRQSSPMHVPFLLENGLMTSVNECDKYFGNASKYSWKDVLTQDDIQQYRLLAKRYLNILIFYFRNILIIFYRTNKRCYSYFYFFN